MVNQNYRMIRKEQEARVERDRIKIAAAINNGQCVYKDERGYYRWKNPITEKDEPYNVNHIIEKYGLDFSWFAQTEKQKKQDAARKKHVQDIMERKKKNARRIDDKHGHFVFLIWDKKTYSSRTRLAPEIQPENLTRLMVLACCLKWNEQYIMCTNDIMDFELKLCSTKARIRDIRKILMLSRATFARFWEDVTKKGYLTGDEDNGYQLSGIFRRGELKGTYAQRVHTEYFRLWYYQDCGTESESVRANNHRRMGKVLSLAPYLHYQHNILCANPLVEEPEKIKPLKGPEIAKRLGTNTDNWKRDLADLRKLTFFWNAAEQYMFAENTECGSLPKGYYLNATIIYFGEADYYPFLQIKPFYYLHPNMIPDHDSEAPEVYYTSDLYPDENDVFMDGHTTWSYLSSTNTSGPPVFI